MKSIRDLFDRIYQVSRGSCFVLMPFAPELDEIYSKVLKPTVQAHPLNMVCTRADEIYSEKPIITDIWEHIQKAEIIIADLTNKNPNVLYELGLCHAIGKKVILISQSIEDIPFDLRHLRVIIYKHYQNGIDALKSQLLRTINTIRQSSYEANFENNANKIPDWCSSAVTIKNSLEYKGEWYGIHTSIDNTGKPVFSKHKYNIAIENNKIYGMVHDQLMGKKYDLKGTFIGNGLFWVFDDPCDPRNFAIEVYFSPITSIRLGGLILALDYHTGRAFISPTLTQRNTFPNKETFLSEMEIFKKKVRIDNRSLIAKKIRSDDT